MVQKSDSIVAQIGGNECVFRYAHSYSKFECDMIEEVLSNSSSKLSGNKRARFNVGGHISQITVINDKVRMLDEREALILIRMTDGNVTATVYNGVDCNFDFEFNDSLSKLNKGYVPEVINFIDSLKNGIKGDGKIGATVIIVDEYSSLADIKSDSRFDNCFLLFQEDDE